MELEALSEMVIGAAIEVHRLLGPGLLESAYESCLAHELTLRNVAFERQVVLPIHYKGVDVDAGFRVDLWVERQLIVELKAVDKIHPIHTAQVITYLKLTQCPVGLLLNFNSDVMRNGIKRIVNTPTVTPIPTPAIPPPTTSNPSASP